MSLSIERNRPFLELLATSKDKEQKQALLETATPGQLRALCECVRSICKGRFNFTPEQKNKLLSHSKTLCQLASSQISLKKKQHFLQELLRDEQNKTKEEQSESESESESENESVEKSEDGDSIEKSEDSESENEEEKGVNDTNQTGGGIFSILLPILASTVLPSLLKK